MFCLLLVFAAIASQGCGGSSSSPAPRGGGSIVIGGDTILRIDAFDTDSNDKFDFLDLDGFSAKHIQASSSPSSVDAQVPAVIFFEKLKDSYAESPDTVAVNLQAGTEYTVEFSRNFTDPIESLLPVIEILDPVSKAPLNNAIQFTVYPEANPSLVCMTFTPSVTGEYLIRISGTYLTPAEENVSGDSTNEFYSMIVNTIGQNEADTLDSIYGNGSAESPSTESADKSCVLLIYKELRNERGEPGYYTRFKFADDYGNVTGTVDIEDVIEIRRLYLEFIADYLNGTLSQLTDDDLQELLLWYDLMQEHQGLYDLIGDGADVEVSSAATNDLNSAKSSIPSTLEGVQYNNTYTLGSGYFGVTGYQAMGHAMQDFRLAVPETKSVSSNYKADFISSQQEQEKFSKTTVGGSFAKGGFGLSASLSSMSSYKYGLTSTTLVIHYDEQETTPRLLNMADYRLTASADEQLARGLTNFRNSYGDYFVAGYVYGGTYDAYISITTETTEQLQEVKSKLRAKYQSLDEMGAKASAQLANETKEILNKYKASVSVEIRTSGSSASDPDPKSITPTKGKNSVEAVGDVIAELLKFRSELSKQSPAQFAPVSVVLKRYSLLAPVLAKMNTDGDDGTIPIAPDTTVLIQRFNRSLITLGAYNQVIAGLDNTKMDAAVRTSYDNAYQDIIATITSDPNFYSNRSKVEQTEAAMNRLSKELKAVGDRYVFYKMLVTAQQKERNAYSEYNADQDDAGDEDTHHQPFGTNGGGSTGYREFYVSTAVTEDIQAGKSETLNGVQSYKDAGRRYWGTSEHNMANVNPSYTAYTSAGGSDAAFCYVSVTAENKSNCHRRFSNYPVAGKSGLDFDFKSGYSRWATWTVKYQTMQFTREKYPFFGLER